MNTTSYEYDLKKYNEVVSRISSYSFHMIFTRIRIGRMEYDLVYDTTLYDLVVFGTPDAMSIFSSIQTAVDRQTVRLRPVHST